MASLGAGVVGGEGGACCFAGVLLLGAWGPGAAASDLGLGAGAADVLGSGCVGCVGAACFAGAVVEVGA